MIDKLPPGTRHLLIGLLAAVLTALSESVPDLGLHPALAAVTGAALGYAVLVLTPLTKQYGIGSKRAAEGPSDYAGG